MRPLRSAILAMALLAPANAWAAPQPPKPLPSEVRLSDEDKEKVLEEAAARKREQLAPIEQPGPRIHGEVGFAVGTGGYSSVYGTAIVPLEGDGVAILSLDSTDFGSRRSHFGPQP